MAAFATIVGLTLCAWPSAPVAARAAAARAVRPDTALSVTYPESGGIASDRRNRPVRASRSIIRKSIASPIRQPTGGAHRGYPTAIACVAATEHGGLYDRSSNPTHFGKYQFDRQTWAAQGGNPATWGVASPAEQEAVFAAAVAIGDLYHGWLEWDHC